MAATGSTEVDDVVPIVATIAIGRRPAARSAAIAAASASGPQLEPLVRRDAHERVATRGPSVMHAFSIGAVRLGRGVDAQRRHVRADRPGPCRATSSPAAWRAAASAMSDEVDAVSVSRPSNASGSPSAWRSQPTTTSSSSVPIGDVRHSIGFWPSAAVSISPRIPGPDAVVAK